MAQTPFPVWISLAVYRRLALAYPKGFRRQFGDHLFHAFDDACRAAWHGKGALGLAKLWMATLVDLAVEGSLERMKVERPLDKSSLAPIRVNTWSIGPSNALRAGT